MNWYMILFIYSFLAPMGTFIGLLTEIGEDLKALSRTSGIYICEKRFHFI